MKNTGPLRVMYFDHTAMMGGGEIALLNLISHINRESVRPVVVLCADGPLAEALRPVAEIHILELPENIRRTKKDGLGIGTLLKVKEFFQIARYINRLHKFIRQNNIDIVHTNSLKADIIGGLAARCAFTPVIWHVRDRIADDYLPSSVANVFRLLARVVPTVVVANSAATMETLGLSLKRGKVVHDGTSLPPIFEAPANKQHLQVGLIGRICPWKGQDIFIQSVAMVKTRFPAARFQIVGSALFDEQEYERSVRALCTQLHLNDVVTFTGFRSDIATVLHELDLVVHASTIGEPFGQVIIEGMAAAKPVIATNGGGVPEIVKQDETGLLVPMGDAIAMADAICQLLENPTQRLEMGSKGRERVRAKFTLQRTAAGVESIYSILSDTHKLRNDPEASQTISSFHPTQPSVYPREI